MSSLKVGTRCTSSSGRTSTWKASRSGSRFSLPEDRMRIDWFIGEVYPSLRKSAIGGDFHHMAAPPPWGTPWRAGTSGLGRGPPFAIPCSRKGGRYDTGTVDAGFARGAGGAGLGSDRAGDAHHSQQQGRDCGEAV